MAVKSMRRRFNLRSRPIDRWVLGSVLIETVVLATIFLFVLFPAIGA